MLSPNDRYRKRKGDEWRLVDVAMLPPLENVDPDRLKLFSKDEIRSYLRHYGTYRSHNVLHLKHNVYHDGLRTTVRDLF